MQSDFLFVEPTAFPRQSAIADLYRSVDLKDAFAIQLPPGASGDPDVLARFLFSNQPAWIGILTNIRDAIVSPLGLKTASELASLPGDDNARRIGFFKVYSTSEAEIVVGEDDKHLDFRVSLLCSRGADPHAGHTLTAQRPSTMQ